MNPILIVLLVALALILATNRRQVGNAKTMGEMWEPVRENGWVRSTLLTVGGLLVFALLFIASVGLVVLTVTTKTIQVLAFVASAVQTHLKDVLNPPMPIVRAEAA
jgi:hypothetical protein